MFLKRCKNIYTVINGEEVSKIYIYKKIYNLILFDIETDVKLRLHDQLNNSEHLP